MERHHLLGERGRLGAPVLHLTEGATGTGPNQQGIPFAQIYGEDRGQLDLSASYTLKNIRSQPQLTFNVLNITGEERRSYFAYPNAVNDMYDPGTTFTVGIRGTF